MDDLTQTLGVLAEAPDDHLATLLSKECRSFLDSGPHDINTQVRFVRDLRDKAVYAGGASSFVMATFAAMLASFPESDDEATERRTSLLF